MLGENKDLKMAMGIAIMLFTNGNCLHFLRYIVNDLSDFFLTLVY